MSLKRVFQISFASLALVAVGLIYRGIHPDAGIQPVPVGASSVARQVDKPGLSSTTHGPVAAAPTQPVAPAVSASRPAPELPDQVRQLLPSIEGVVTNWKEFKPQKITIAPYPDMPVDFEATSIREEHGRTVWTGRNKDLEGAFLVVAATETDWHATLIMPPLDAFEIHIAGQTVTMLEKSTSAELCGTPPGIAPRPTADVIRNESADHFEIPVAAAADSLTTVDVLFFYDAETLPFVGNSAANFETRMITYIASSNLALENSLVTNFKWRYLASYPAPAYTTNVDMTEDLYYITGRKDNGVAFPNPVNDFVTQKAVLHGADQVVLFVGGNRNYGGIAWSPNPGSVLPLAYRSAVVAANTSYRALAHELSHNFGCHHDRLTETASDGDGRYNYGFRYTQVGQDRGTIMSYADFRVDYFSNPDVTFNGIVLGVPEAQPKAANNARVLRDSALAMIVARAAVDAPAITSQPQSVSVTLGQPFTLSVTATGSNLTYQWKLAGTDIAGATSSSYSKSTSVSGDAGSYTVTVSNITGQVTSTAATVTLNAVVTPPPAAPVSGGGGGGGGGAIDGWFTALCGTLVILRCALKKRAS